MPNRQHPRRWRRHSILDLAPLEFDCMNVLWPLGEATVRDVRQALAPTRPRAYTTIMTILDRLAQKGVVARRKAGRAWVYRPNLSADEARRHAVAQLVDGLLRWLGGGACRASLTAHGRRRSQGPRPDRVSKFELGELAMKTGDSERMCTMTAHKILHSRHSLSHPRRCWRPWPASPTRSFAA